MSSVDRGWSRDGAGRSWGPSDSCSKPNGLLMKILVDLSDSLLSKGNSLPPERGWARRKNWEAVWPLFSVNPFLFSLPRCYDSILLSYILWTIKMKIKVQGNTLKSNVNLIKLSTGSKFCIYSWSFFYFSERKDTLTLALSPSPSVQCNFWLIPFQTPKLQKALGSTHSFPIRLSTKTVAFLSKLVNFCKCEAPYNF